MALPLEAFIQQLEDSGILVGDTLNDFIPPKAAPRDAEELALELVSKKKLTRFQTEEISKGKGKSLTLGNYVLMEKIGAGGMGQVFKAEHRRMHRIVAIKVLPPNLTKDEAAIARFEREVTAAAKLNHPNIVTAYDADEAGGVHFLVMELVEGSDLSAVVKKNGPFSIEHSVNCILQAAKGLEFAHKKGVVHRDIKPANLLLDTEGTVKILDMGLARLSLDGDEAPQADLTNTGTIMGTVDYMAPEQALDTKTADARADIYALGCSLFYLLTGTPTYQGDTLMKKLVAHREYPIPSLRAARPEVSEQLEAVFKKMVAKKLEDRYQTMTAVIATLERCSSAQNTTQTFHQSANTAFDKTTTFSSSQMTSAEATILSTSSVKSTPAKQGNHKKLALIGATVIGVAMLAVIIVSLRTKDGTLIVEVDQPDSTVQVLDSEGVVKITKKDVKGTVSISVDPGKHRLKVEKDGFTVFGQEFEMKSGGKAEIAAKLEPLKAQPVVAARKPLGFEAPGFDEWMKEVAVMPAKKQVEAVAKKLQELNPGFDGKLTGVWGSPAPTIELGVVTGLGFSTDNVTDISPVRVLEGLWYLDCHGSHPRQGSLVDLLPLKGMPLTDLVICDNPISDLLPLKGMNLRHLNIAFTKVADLSPLKGMMLEKIELCFTPISDLSVLRGMPLDEVNCHGTQVSDLSPLNGLRLTELNCGLTKIADLSPLRGMPLTKLNFISSQVSDLSPLKGLPLTELSFWNTPVSDLSPLKEMSLTVFDCGKTQVSDLLPLQQMKLIEFRFIPKNITNGMDIIRQMKSLNTIRVGWADNERFAPDEFWKQYDAGEFDKPTASKPLFFQTPGFDKWVNEVSDMPAEKQLKAVAKKLQELNPGFDGTLLGVWNSPTPTIEQGVVTGLGFSTDNVTDISPVRALEGLSYLGAHGSYPRQGSLVDLSPLKGMPLKDLLISHNQISHLLPLKGMKLRSLNIAFTKVADLSPLKSMMLENFILAATKVTDLSALKEMRLNRIEIECTQVSDLSPLSNMPLMLLRTFENKVTDFSLLKELPLKTISLDFKPDRDTELLRSIKTLETINDKPIAEFWKEAEVQQKGKKLGFQMPGFDQWVKDVQALPAEKQVEAVSKKLVELNPGFDGKVGDRFRKDPPLIEDGRVKNFGFLTDYVTDISPVRALRDVGILNISSSDSSEGNLVDLSPLQGMKYMWGLECSCTKISDLSPLQGMQLTYLVVTSTQISDLRPLAGMKLTYLGIGYTRVSDLSPLKGMPLNHLVLHGTPVSDLSGLSGLPIKFLALNVTPVLDLSALAGMPLKEIEFTSTEVSDVSPLQGMELECINFTPENIKHGMSVIREMSSVKTIGIGWRKQTDFDVKDFWKKYDAGEFGKPTASKPLFFQTPGFHQWMKDVQALPAEQQVEAVRKKLVELNPVFDGKVTPVINDGAVSSFSFYADKVTDISPVMVLTELKYLECWGSGLKQGTLIDLTPIKAMKLTHLNFSATQVSDLTPLKGLPLEVLIFGNSQVSDLSPLKGMRLHELHCNWTKVTDLSPLKDFPPDKSLLRLQIRRR